MKRIEPHPNYTISTHEFKNIPLLIQLHPRSFPQSAPASDEANLLTPLPTTDLIPPTRKALLVARELAKTVWRERQMSPPYALPPPCHLLPPILVPTNLAPPPKPQTAPSPNSSPTCNPSQPYSAPRSSPRSHPPPRSVRSSRTARRSRTEVLLRRRCWGSLRWGR